MIFAIKVSISHCRVANNNWALVFVSKIIMGLVTVVLLPSTCIHCSLLCYHDLTFVVCHVETSSMGVMVQRPPRMKSICGSNQRNWLLIQATQRSGSMETTNHFCLFFE